MASTPCKRITLLILIIWVCLMGIVYIRTSSSLCLLTKIQRVAEVLRLTKNATTQYEVRGKGFHFIPNTTIPVNRQFEEIDIKTSTPAIVGPNEAVEPLPKQACVHPKLELYDPVMMAYYSKRGRPNCPGKDWVYIENGTLHFTPEVVSEHKSISCNYTPIVRINESTNTVGTPVINISRPFSIKHDAFKIVCKGGNRTYDNVHRGVPFRKDFVDRKQDPMLNGFEGMSIAIFGFDSMSRMSWLRRLPITRKYFVEKLGAIELEQHNILGDGTTAVMFPMLTGKFEWELPECRVKFKGADYMDNFPWIWHDFKQSGYLTSWSNCKPKSAPFNYRMMGFKHQPTDFYARKFYVDAYPRLRGFCFGSQSSADIWLQNFRDIFYMYKQQRKFLFHFITDFSHEDNNLLTQFDGPLQEMLQRLHEGGYLNNTLFILMGDHGARYAKVRSTISGKLEERLPYFSLLFPPWFQKKYPEAMKNLKTNAHRLTTPFDIHETFRNFFNYSGAGVGSLDKRGISLFKEIPLTRTCNDAVIASHWCACLDWTEVDASDPGAKAALRATLDTINGYTKDYRTDCALLAVKNVTMVTKMEMGKDMLRFRKTDPNGGIYNVDLSSQQKGDKDLYQLTFYTQPGDGQFEVTVTHNLLTNRFMVSEKEISRINKYGDAPHCVLDRNRQIRQYCYCKDLLNV